MRFQTLVSDFVSRINFELKRAERYRIFVSLVIFNLGPVLEIVDKNSPDANTARHSFLDELNDVIHHSIREIDAVSNSSQPKIGILCPETSRQGAEAAAKRLSNVLNSFCGDYLKKPGDYLIPVEISSFPDAAGARSITSYLDEFVIH